MDDLISRQEALEAIRNCVNAYFNNLPTLIYLEEAETALRLLPSAQPEITDEQAIEHLQSTGWMQNHDKQMYEMGLRERLADDSVSYDALLPPAQPEIIRCKDCKYCDRGIDEDGNPFLKCLGWVYGGTQEEDFCSHAERRTDERVVMEMDGGV